MPIYEYLCESCGRITEMMQKITDPPPRVCSECGSKKVAKLVSRSAFQLKGGGWYADLYSSPKKDAAKGDGKSAAAGEKKPPAAKAPAAKAPTEKAAAPEKKTSAQ